jgi:hypothetical protein
MVMQADNSIVIAISNKQLMCYALLAVTLGDNFHYHSAQFLPGLMLSATRQLTGNFEQYGGK